MALDEHGIALPKYLKRDTWDSVIDGAATDRNQDLLGVRDQAIIALMFSSGMRGMELCNLNVEDLDLTERKALIRRGKGGKPRWAYFSADAGELLESWLQVRPRHPEDTPRQQRGPLWISRKGNRLSTRMLRVLSDHAANRGGLDQHVHPHMFRHSCATELLRKTGNLRKVQKHLGHARVTTTEIYAAVIDEDLARDVEDL